MNIVWDERKRQANIVKHGLDFADVTMDFFDGALIRGAKRNRMMAIGKLRNQTISVVFFRLGSQGLAIISMRPARADERKLLR